MVKNLQLIQDISLTGIERIRDLLSEVARVAVNFKQAESHSLKTGSDCEKYRKIPEWARILHNYVNMLLSRDLKGDREKMSGYRLSLKV